MNTKYLAVGKALAGFALDAAKVSEARIVETVNKAGFKAQQSKES